jgi:hypothetical protein
VPHRAPCALADLGAAARGAAPAGLGHVELREDDLQVPNACLVR